MAGHQRLQGRPRINACPTLQPELACAEVKLIHAGHDAWARNFTSAKQRADDVAQGLAKVAAGIEACKPPAPPPVAVVPPKITLQADATFGFDEGDESGLLAAGRSTLDKLATDLRGNQDVTRIDMIGYTDRIGSAAYNQRLSVQRAETVKRYRSSVASACRSTPEAQARATRSCPASSATAPR